MDLGPICHVLFFKLEFSNLVAIRLMEVMKKNTNVQRSIFQIVPTRLKTLKHCG